MLNSIKQQLSNSIDKSLVECLLECYVELKENYYLGKHKPSELDAGHFAEIIIRILQYITNPDHSFTSIEKNLNSFDKIVSSFAQLPASDFHDSIRLHIPRTLQAIYGVRNRRGVAHVGGDVNPNFTDATFLVVTCDWIMAELVRLYYASSLEEAQKLVDSIVERKAPIIQDFSGYLKVLDPKLSIPNKVLVLLYHRGEEGASVQELRGWGRTSSSNFSTALARLENERCHIHCDGSRCFITRTGVRFVEANIPLQL